MKEDWAAIRRSAGDKQREKDPETTTEKPPRNQAEEQTENYPTRFQHASFEEILSSPESQNCFPAMSTRVEREFKTLT